MTEFSRQQSLMLNRAAFYRDQSEHYRKLADLYETLAQREENMALYYQEHQKRENNEHTIR